MAWLDSLTPQAQFAFFTMLKIACVLGPLLTLVAYAVLAERKVSALIQDRVGPNRVSLPLIGGIPVIGPFLTKLGFWHPLVDGVKSFIKEDFTPAHVRKIYFWLAPAIALVPAFLVIAVIPFGSTLGSQKMVIADLNVGILYTFGIVSLGVYGIVLAGYAANSKFPFLGGIRSSAQMISYELAMGMSVVPVFLVVGDLNLSKIIEHQAHNGWNVFPLFGGGFSLQTLLLVPCGMLSFTIFFVAAFAETNRLPFDLPESESELVGGYHTEYSSMKFGMFFIGEYANMFAGAAMMTTLFFGGWTLPFFGLDQAADSVWKGLLHIGIFMAKMFAFMGIFIWVRWMLPRFRYDQLMDLGWRRLIPLALANIILTAAVLALTDR
ncbi:MAG: NADH-quinone oxidoreductase subunit H [Verrucomicrobia bacterium]|nr:NADH-quinone oxidoreductase subunit H [Verrucomicrobiota bacterium]